MRIPTLALSLVIALQCSVSSARAQVSQDWLHRCNIAPTGYEQFLDAQIAPSGAVYATGMTGAISGHGLHDVLLEKFDAAGNVAWIRTFDYAGGYMDYGRAIVIEPGTESIYVVGRCDSMVTQGLVQKYDSSGTLLWTSAYTAQNGTAEFYAACLTPSGNIAALADQGAGGFGVAEFDPQGNLLWTNVETLGDDYAANIASDSNGDIVICGPYYASGNNTYMGVTRFSANGAFLWDRLISGGGLGYQSAYALLLDGAGSTYVGGTLVTQATVTNEALVKLDAAGTVIWTQLHKGTQTDPTLAVEAVESLSLAANGNIRASGVCTNVGSGRDLQVLEYTPSGQLVWASTWDSPGQGTEYFTSAKIEPDGTQTVIAASRSAAGIFETLIVHWDTHGNSLGAEIVDLSILGPSVAYQGTIGNDGTRVFFGSWPSGPNTDAIALQVREQSVSYCFGDGSNGDCPCANSSLPGEGRGCTNSQGESARLTSSGLASLASDSLQLTSAGELPLTTCIFLQGGGISAPAPFGDGILCLAAPLRRMFVHSSSGGAVSAPAGADASISARSAALGDPISAGARRSYQVLYRDPAAGFCPPPSGSAFNLSSALSVTWIQ